MSAPEGVCVVWRGWPDDDWQLVWFGELPSGGMLRHEKEFDTPAEAADWACRNLGVPVALHFAPKRKKEA